MMEVQSRFLLVAIFGMWAGFLGLMAVVATDEEFPRTVGTVGLFAGLVIAYFGLSRVIHDRPEIVDRRPPYSAANERSDS